MIKAVPVYLDTEIRFRYRSERYVLQVEEEVEEEEEEEEEDKDIVSTIATDTSTTILELTIKTRELLLLLPSCEEAGVIGTA